LSIRGRYDIEEGNYLFTFQSFFKKPFELKRGTNNYIEWTGDPYDARVNLTATYTANNVSFQPLATAFADITTKSGLSRARGDVNVVAQLTDKLFNPKIDFTLEFPPSSPVNSDPGLSFSVQQLQKNTNEITKQATYLVVFGIFAPVGDAGLGTTNTFQEIATNSLSGIFFSVINEQVKKIISSIFKTDKYNFNFSSSLYRKDPINTDGKFGLGSNVNASIGRSLFNNRVIISLGGTVEGIGASSQTIQQSVEVLPDLNLEVLINPSGTFRANLFYRQNIDYLTTSTTGAGRMKRAGLGVSYQKEFDHLFKRKPRPIPAQPEVKKEESATKDSLQISN
jgi:hypothetical protein